MPIARRMPSKWDAVRSVLKVPPVGNLWNLGDSKNTLRKLADLRDDVELFELADDVASALQLADQFTYDNNVLVRVLSSVPPLACLSVDLLRCFISLASSSDLLSMSLLV